jgi:hypothetical protein
MESKRAMIPAIRASIVRLEFLAEAHVKAAHHEERHDNSDEDEVTHEKYGRSGEILPFFSGLALNVFGCCILFPDGLHFHSLCSWFGPVPSAADTRALPPFMQLPEPP